MSTLLEPKTARLQLRQWRDSDRKPFATMNADPLVMEYFPALLSRAESDAAIDRQIAHIDQFGWGFWAVEQLEDQAFIGFVGIKNVTDDMPFAPAVEIGWRLATPYWGKGYASEAARASLRVAFEELALSEVVSFTVVKNVRSRAVMERLGMQEAPATFEHPALPQGHTMRHHSLYRLSRENWRD